MLKQTQSRPTFYTKKMPLNLSSILLVEADPGLRDSRRLLLSTLQHPVLAVGSYADICRLPADSNCRLVAIVVSPNEHEAILVAMHTRRTWPDAKILLLGHPTEAFDDPLYDDAMDPSYNPAGVLASVNRLLGDFPPAPEEADDAQIAH